MSMPNKCWSDVLKSLSDVEAASAFRNIAACTDPVIKAAIANVPSPYEQDLGDESAFQEWILRVVRASLQSPEHGG